MSQKTHYTSVIEPAVKAKITVNFEKYVTKLNKTWDQNAFVYV
jgi:hypothetical protein